MKALKTGVIASLLCLGFLPLAQAQTYPNKPVRMLIPYAPGGTSDIMARALQDAFQAKFNQVLIVENKPGAAGTIASREIARSEPDGYNLLLTNVGPMTVAPNLVKSADYDAVKDFTPITLISTSPLPLAIYSNVKATNVAELIKLAKEKPGELNYSSAGLGSFGHLSTERFAQAAGIKMTHIPYKGQAPAVTALIAGEVDLSLTAPSSILTENIKSGRVRLLGISTTEPSALVPGAVPIANTVPGFSAEFWFGVVGPKGLPDNIVAILNQVFGNALKTDAVKKMYEGFGAEAISSSPKQFADLIAKEATSWREVVQKANITID